MRGKKRKADRDLQEKIQQELIDDSMKVLNSWKLKCDLNNAKYCLVRYMTGFDIPKSWDFDNIVVYKIEKLNYLPGTIRYCIIKYSDTYDFIKNQLKNLMYRLTITSERLTMVFKQTIGPNLTSESANLNIKMLTATDIEEFIKQSKTNINRYTEMITQNNTNITYMNRFMNEL